MRSPWAILFCGLFFGGCASTSNTVDDVHATTEVAPSQVAQSVAVSPQKSSDDALRESQKDADLMIYESWPLETTLDNAHIADVIPVWIEAVDSAVNTLDFSEFYAVNEVGSGLDRVVDALRRAAKRGVKIRFIVDKQMYKDDNTSLPEELAAIPGLELRQIDYNAITGGVQHSKYFIVDGKTAYYGSQNFDYRSLEHISEMGARIRTPQLVEPLKQIYEIDWKLAENPNAPIAQAECMGPVDIDYKGEATRVELLASPQKTLPCADMWDLPKLIALIQGAKTSVSIQLLNYATLNYDKTTFTELDDALTAAAARGVHVRLLVSDWSTRSKYIKDLKRLADIDNIETRMIEIPEHSSGFVPYSRTIHSKFLLVDDDKTWLGTSNWSGDYFYGSRNVGIIAIGKTLHDELSRSFEHYWNSEYAIPVDPDVDYPVKNQAKPSL